MGYFRESRCVELSAIYFVETSLNADWTGVTTVKSFVNAYKATLPVVCVELANTQNNWKEIGSTSLYNDYIINIDIFAKSNGQRIDLADYLVDKLKDGFTYYTHSQTSGSPETLTRTASGRIFIHRFLSNTKLNFGEEGVDKYDLYRHFLSLQVKKDAS
jgi:hypothetical protein